MFIDVVIGVTVIVLVAFMTRISEARMQAPRSRPNSACNADADHLLDLYDDDERLGVFKIHFHDPILDPFNEHFTSPM